MFRLTVFRLVILLSIILLTACQRGQASDLPDIGLDLTIFPTPPAVGLATIKIALTDSEGQPISNASLELEGNMSHAGMVPVFSQPSEIEPGIYEAPLQFTMGGDWFILVKANLPDGRKMERQVDIPGVETE